MQPIRRLILKELLLLFGLLAVVSTGLAWIGINRILDQQIEARSSEDLDKLARDIRRDLSEVERVGRTAARWWQEGAIGTDDIPAAEIQLASLMEEFPSVANLVLISVEGWGLSMSRMPEGLLTYHLDARKEDAQKRYLRKEGHRLAHTFWEPTPYRVYQRPWYLTARQASIPQWVGAYRFVNRPTHGLSYAVPLRDAQGHFQGALCSDIFLDSLSQRTWAVQPTPNSQALVSDNAGKALILPRGTTFQANAGEATPFLKPLSTDFLPLFEELLKRWDVLQHPKKLFPLRHHGTGYSCIVQPLEGVDGVNWFLSMAVPDEDYRGGGRRVALVILGAGVLASLLAAWRAFHMAHRFSGPLERLSGAAQALGTGSVPVSTPSDILEIETLSEALQRAGTAMEKEVELQLKLQHSQRLEMVGTLTGGIAHDVNNQLAAIVGQINLGRELVAPGHPIALRLDRAEEAAQRCARMIRSLLGFTHQAKPELDTVDLNEVVRRTAALLERLLGGRIRLDLDLDPQIPSVLGESVSLEQVLMNLAINARDAMPEGGTLCITTQVQVANEVCLTVRDNGAGIPEDVLPKIFDPFFTTKAVGKGTGLGLAMVFGIIKAHGGRIEVDSERGKGSEFRVYLSSGSGGTSTAPSPRPAEVLTEFLAGRRILVVEDETQLRDLEMEAFTQHHALVETASDGRQGWTLWQGKPFDLVLSDQRMPEMTGTELLAHIRATGSKMPVILASGYGLEGIESVLAQDPNLRYLPKPFTLQQLFAVAQDLLRN